MRAAERSLAVRSVNSARGDALPDDLHHGEVVAVEERRRLRPGVQHPDQRAGGDQRHGGHRAQRRG